MRKVGGDCPATACVTWRPPLSVLLMSSPSAPPSRLRRSLLLAGIVLIALNLRPALASVGPVIGAIREATGLSNVALGLLTTLPLLAFAVFSPLTAQVTRRLGIEGTLGAALLLLTGGILLRTLDAVPLLFLGTLLLGIAIAFGNVLLPSLVKRDFPEKSGVMTSLYSSAMGAGATIAAGVSVPLAAGLGWRGALGLWAIPAVVALLVWLPQLRARTLPRHTGSLGESFRTLGRSGLAWQVALFMGLQSFTFYVLLAWLPEILQSRGMSAEDAGWMLALSQGTGMLGSLLIPLWAGRRHEQQGIVWALGALEGVSLLGLLLPGTALAPLWVSLIGFALGGTFGLALLFIVLRTADAETATELSGLAQATGYLLAATGPALFGLLHDVLRTWWGPLLFLMLVLGGKLVAGLGAARPRLLRRSRPTTR